MGYRTHGVGRPSTRAAKIISHEPRLTGPDDGTTERRGGHRASSAQPGALFVIDGR